MGSKLTPVTPETFAVWKKTRMDKKDAEAEAIRKAKELQSSAGKNSGMSGRDLVCRLQPLHVPLVTFRSRSSNTIPNGSKTRKKLRRTNGIWRDSDARRKRRISPPKKDELQNCRHMTAQMAAAEVLATKRR